MNCAISINDTEETKREASLSALLKNYQKHISLSKKQLSGVIDASMEKVKKHADVLSINIENSRFLSRLPVNGQKRQSDQQRQIRAVIWNWILKKRLRRAFPILKLRIWV